MTTADRHIPVLLAEVIQALTPHDDGIYIDGTFGVGGYTRAILGTAACRVWAIDRDPAAVERGNRIAEEFKGRLSIIEGCFGDVGDLVRTTVGALADGVTFDVGVSSPQLDDPERGFSFREDGPLDMRMARAGTSAADIVNETSEQDLANIIYRFGEEKASRAVARAIVEARREAPITRTMQLAEIVRRVVRKSKDGLDPATRTFQGLRIHVNDELGELQRGLEGAEQILAPGGRLAVVSFHSLEDRLVKRFLHGRSRTGSGESRHVPQAPDTVRRPTFKLIGRKAIRPGETEVRENPRARSARLRVAQRTEAPMAQAVA